MKHYLINTNFVDGQNNSKYHDRAPVSNVQIQKISILPPQKGLEFPGVEGGGGGGFCKAKKIKEMYEA